MVILTITLRRLPIQIVNLIFAGVEKEILTYLVRVVVLFVSLGVYIDTGMCKTIFVGKFPRCILLLLVPC